MENQKMTAASIQGEIKSLGSSAYLKFLIPSLIGIGLFIFPVPSGTGSLTLLIGIIIDWFSAVVGKTGLIYCAMAVCTISAVSGLFTKIFKPKGYQKAWLNDLFNPSWPYLFVRVVAAVLCWLVRFQVGPEWITSSNTGGMSLNSLMPTLFAYFLFCGFLLPFLTDFGAMDYIGSLLRKAMKPLFTIPGRSALDCVASFLGSGTVGIQITTNQYDSGYYTAREAANICCCWSICSVPFALTCAKTCQVADYFVPLYLAVCVACVIEAIILPRIYPLNKIPDEYNPETGCQISENHPEGVKPSLWGRYQGILKARSTKWGPTMAKGALSTASIWLNLNPMVMFCGTFAMAIARYTPIFDYIAMPMTWLLNLCQIPEAATAAPACIIGFCGMFIPATLAPLCESAMTRFFICIIELTQLLYVSENVALIMKSKVPLSFGKMVVVYLLRTIIAIPVAALFAHLIF